MSTTLGKLVNLETNEKIDFVLAPENFSLRKSFDFTQEPCIGEAHPIINYRSGGATALSYHLRLDKDADPNSDPKKMDKFLKSLNVVDPNTKTPPLIEFSMGSFHFHGFTSNYVWNSLRFDAEGNWMSATLDMTLLSERDYEHG